ncbi:prolyl oligopeptidase family serine peptidase [Streptacidiphilus neutrinimicus]|uniref:prolyl oligopeptidase family serine peptidase n=1 Tax=Streptacidiphilus neutrinimicus TaxID=105420 RepID=UPI000A6D59B6|nr:prolyl oligopeptidase family serine peptidase [Streptacidiphilus neutrinimicus]
MASSASFPPASDPDPVPAPTAPTADAASAADAAPTASAADAWQAADSASAADAGQATPDSLPRQLARTRRFTLGAPAQLAVTADGATVLFLRGRDGADARTCLWARELATGEERVVVDGADGAVTAYGTDAAGRRVAFVRAGRLWLADLGTGPSAPDVVRPVHGVHGPVSDPRPDPTGRRIAYLDGRALRVVDLAGSDDRAVAAPGPGDGPEVRYGVSEHVARESMSRPCGYWWSPDGQRLLVARIDEEPVAVWYVADPANPAVPPRAVRYASVGTANADVRLGIVDAVRREHPRPEAEGDWTEVAWDRAAFEYLTSAGWDAHGPFASVQSRDQRTVRVLGVDPAAGATRLLAEQHDEAWVQLVRGLPVRTASGALLTHLDVGDTRHLAADGEPLTPPGLNLREVLGVDGDDVLFTATSESDPFSTHLWRVGVPDGTPEQLSAEPGVHDGVLRGGALVRPGDLADLSETPLVPLRRTLLRVGERRLCTAVHLPSWHTPGSRLPVLLDPYAGPAMQRVTAGGGWATHLSQWFAEQGFVVLVVDGVGTPGRGPRWEREVHGDVFAGPLRDQIDALHAVAETHPEYGLDLERVAIRGWSYSGSLAEVAVLRRPDVFHAAVAGAGVTDQLLYDTHWRERFLGHPDSSPEAYAACDILRDAPKLRRPLLLMHGLGDDNVFPVSTLRLSQALLAAGRPHEVLPLSGAGHRVTQQAVAENLILHQLDFLRRALRLKD